MKTRKTISINEDIWDMICKNAEILGMSASNYISLCCVQQAQQSVALSTMPDLKKFFDAFDDDTIKKLKEMVKK